MNISAEVISRAQGGDKAARDEVIVRSLPVIRSTANKLACSFLSADDLQSEGVIAAIEDLHLFDPAKGSFVNFIRFRAFKRMLRIRNQERRFYSRWRQGVSDNIQAPQLPDSVDELLAPLGEDSRELVQRYFGLGQNAETSKDIAADYGVDPSRVRQLVMSAIETIQLHASQCA